MPVLLEQPPRGGDREVADVLVGRRDVLAAQAELLDDHRLRDAAGGGDLRGGHDALGEVVGGGGEPDARSCGSPFPEPIVRAMIRPSSSSISGESSSRPAQRIQRIPTSSPMPISAQASSSGSPSAISPALHRLRAGRRRSRS